MSETRDGSYDESAVLEYLKVQSWMKTRRLVAVIVNCVVLMGLLILTNVLGWSDVIGGQEVGNGWIIVGVIVSICAIIAILLDLILRRDV